MDNSCDSLYQGKTNTKYRTLKNIKIEIEGTRFNKYLHSVKDWFRTIGTDCSSRSYMRNVLPQAIGQGPKKFGHTYKVRIEYSAIVIKQNM